MIKSCEDVKTVNDFEEFCETLRSVRIMGLKETAKLIVWGSPAIINPGVFANLFQPKGEDK